jgi:hypothetical protein
METELESRKLVELRRTITPYVGHTIILVGITVYLAYVAQKTSQWGLLWGAALLWPLFAFAYFYFGLKYRVFWDETGVVMRASGLKERRIRYEEISHVWYERANVTESLSQSRPFRRIVVWGHKRDPKAFVDISLRHFKLEDIRELLNSIRSHRLDLTIPTVSPDGRVSTVGPGT